LKQTINQSIIPLSFSSQHNNNNKSMKVGRGGRGNSSVVQTRAFFGNFGKKKDTSGQPMVCIDCGYVYRGDFSMLPNTYKCPTCGVGKNRFKAQMMPSIGVAAPKKQAPTFNSAGVLAAKKANKEAFRKKRASAGAAKSPRELAREKMLEEQAKKDNEKKGGGGWFSR
jgi:rubredoxin